MALIARAEDLNLAGVETVLRTIMDVPVENRDDKSLMPSWFVTRDWQGVLESDSYVQQNQRNLYSFCEQLFALAQEPRTHLRKIDQSLSRLIDCFIDVNEVKEAGLTENDLALRGLDLLQRLPSPPLELVGLPAGICKDYLYDPTLPCQWSSLQVAKFFSVNTIKMALFIVSTADSTTEDTYPNALAELLDVASELAAQVTSHEGSHCWYIVRAALYSSWQRSVHLSQYWDLGRTIIGNASDKISSGSRLRLRSPVPMLGLSVQQLGIQAAQGKAGSMCSWAFEVLRTGAVGTSADFRTFHSRYNRVWADAPGRCRKHSAKSCAGNSPDRCHRFYGMRINDQSMHDYKCSEPCKRLYWDEESYRAISGPRAARLDECKPDQNQLIKYCRTSNKTLAVSHVWSHGQGGRPHQGVNTCLHNRYVNIAKRLGCDSYWWDSVCIPTDHNLRTEAIGYINGTFASSKVSLVCDSDLMSMDMSEVSLVNEESLLSTLLVSDWNVRAWTFLEGIRSRQQIHLLCKDNVVISFRQVIKDIYDFGRIDLSVLAFHLSHILPNFSPPVPSRVRRNGDVFHPRDDEIHRRILYMMREEGGEVLSLRPASRKGDDIVIWSLLTGEDTSKTPDDFWQRYFGPKFEMRPWFPKEIRTGFLMSSSCRMKQRGRSWAPCTPYFRPKSSPYLNKSPSYRAYSALDSFLGEITTKGLMADWLCYEFSALRKSVYLSSREDQKLHVIWRRFLIASTWGALLQPVSDFDHRTYHETNGIATHYGGRVTGTMVAVLGSRSVQKPSLKPADERGWAWKGIFVWDKDVPLPEFTYVKDFLIE